MDSVKTTEFASTFQLHVDAIAWDLRYNQDGIRDLKPSAIAEILDLCPEQNVWIYEPDPMEPESGALYATFRLFASDGTIFHVACKLSSSSEILEWIGPHDIVFPKLDHAQVQRPMAA